MSRKLLAAFLSCAALALSAASADSDLVRWWPRVKPACVVADLEQFAVLEFSSELQLKGDVTVKISLPDGVKYVSCVTAWPNPDKPYISACPALEESAFPAKIEAGGNNVTMQFKDGSFDRPSRSYLAMVIGVGDLKPGCGYSARVEVATASGQSYAENIAMEVRPALSGVQSKAPLIMWNFQGLDEQFIPVYMDGMVKAGVNRFYEMREETPGKKAVVDFQKQFNTVHGTAFFGERIGKYFEKNGLPAELVGRTDIVFDNAWLLDHPEVMEVFMREYYKYLMDGKQFKVIIYDAERGSFKKGGKEIVGDLTAYSLAKFGKQFNIPAAELTPEIITEKYAAQWTRYCCEQSMELAKFANKMAKKYYPGCTFEVYSGYEYDFPPHDNLTRSSYAVDWKLMREAGMDAAGCGYFGTPQEIAHTAEAVSGVCHMLPAEMYMEGFRTGGVPMPRLGVENFAFRLISSYLASGGHGIQLWYGAVMHGGGLAALDIYTKFANATSDFLDGATALPADGLVRVMPKAFSENVYVFEKAGKKMVIVLNPTESPANVRLTFEVGSGFRPQMLKLEPWSWNISEY